MIPLTTKFVDLLLDEGYALDDLLEGTSTTKALLESQVEVMSWPDFLTIIRNAIRLTGNPALGLWLGRRVKLASLGLLGFASISSPTISEGVMLFTRYSTLVAGHVRPELEFVARTPGAPMHPTIRFVEENPHEDLDVFLMEATTRFIADLGLSFLPGRGFDWLQFDLKYPEPEHWNAANFEFPVRFSMPEHRVWVDPTPFFEPRMTGDPHALRAIEPLLAGRLTEANEEVDLADRIRGALRRAFESDTADLPSSSEMAETLGWTRYRLQGELAKTGVGYRDLVNEMRRTFALEALADGSATIESIGRRLGYQHPSNFRRAFRRWTGMSPQAYRQERGTE